MCRSSRRLIGLVILLVSITLFIARYARAADAAASAPWLLPENAEKYIFIGTTVWDIDSGTMVSPTDAPKGVSNEYARLIARSVPGVNDGLFLCTVDPNAPPGTGGVGGVMKYDFSAKQTPALPEQAVKELQSSQPAVWAAPDHRRVVWIQGGDYWRGEVDWVNYKIINRKQITSVGAFDAHNTPILWWGQLLFVWGNFDKDKPVVRINLATSAVDELETYHVFSQSVVPAASGIGLSMVSPSACRVVGVTRSIIYSYDVRTGKATNFHNKYEDDSATRNLDLLNSAAPPFWADDDTAYVFNTLGTVAKLDFRNGLMDLKTNPQLALAGHTGINRVIGVVPSGRSVDMASFSPGPNPNVPIFKSRFLVDITTGQITTLPFDDKAAGKWIDDSTFIYTRDKGGLTSIGTWLYDRTSNANKHLSGSQIDIGRMLVFPKRKQIIAISQQSGDNLIRLNLDGSPSQNLGPCSLAMPVRMPEQSIDLRASKTSDELWKPVAVDETALAATQPAEAAVGKQKLEELVKDRSDDDKKFADQAYDYATHNTVLSNYYDPVKVAMKILAAHGAKPSDPINNLVVGLDVSDCIDRDRIAQWGHDHAMAMMGGDGTVTADQKNQIADKTGPAVADAVFQQPKPDIHGINSIFQKAYADARASVIGGSANNAAANTPTAANPPANAPANTSADASTQPQQADTQSSSNSQQSQQSNVPAQVNKTTKKTKRAKDATDQLNKIFGH